MNKTDPIAWHRVSQIETAMFNLIAPTARSQLQQGRKETGAKNAELGTSVHVSVLHPELGNTIPDNGGQDVKCREYSTHNTCVADAMLMPMTFTV